MDNIINEIMVKAEEWTVIFMFLACVRIYLEIIGFDFQRLPITKALSSQLGGKKMQGYHKFGLYISIGYVILFSPGILLG